MRRDLLTSAPEAFWRVFRVSVGFGNLLSQMPHYPVSGLGKKSLGFTLAVAVDSAAN